MKVQGSSFARQANSEPCSFWIKNSYMSRAVVRRVTDLKLRSDDVPTKTLPPASNNISSTIPNQESRNPVIMQGTYQSRTS